LQDQRDLGIEGAGAGRRRCGNGGRCGPVGACRTRRSRRQGFRLGVRFGLGKLVLQRGDALLVSSFHFVDLAADGGQIGIGGRLRTERNGKQGGHDYRWLVQHGILLKTQ